MHDKKDITIEKVYEMVVDLKRDMNFIKKKFVQEPDFCDEFILRMKDIDLEETVMVNDFCETYRL
ncbi:MAG: hypothetical protein U5R06_16100 [candidate division KSB1 bacterium]|nr:hypothetical protein [candidate division KSB1 bacterium]